MSTVTDVCVGGLWRRTKLVCWASLFAFSQSEIATSYIFICCPNFVRLQQDFPVRILGSKYM